MKELNELTFPEDVRYSKEHEWARTADGKVIAGISDYAQNQLGDIVFVELPQIGDAFAKGDEFGTVESVKAVSELYMPIGGKILAVNAALEEEPALVNDKPYDEGWLIEIEPDDPGQIDTLLTRDAYRELLQGDA